MLRIRKTKIFGLSNQVKTQTEVLAFRSPTIYKRFEVLLNNLAWLMETELVSSRNI
jgi:hypothetical protein